MNKLVKKILRNKLRLHALDEILTDTQNLKDTVDSIKSQLGAASKNADLLRLENIQLSQGRVELRQLTKINSPNINDNELKVFSQWGEDGIIQFLIRNIKISSETFIEFGVQDYTESNTRFLLMNNNWSGLVIDGSKENINTIGNSYYFWMYDLTAVHNFITKKNINKIIKDSGFAGELGILSIDIDGNDYWIWEAIDCVDPALVVIEYNHRFGPEKKVTVPYNDSFERSKAHYSMVYFGASLQALNQLAEEKGYDFVGCNMAGNNAFFVKKALRPAHIKKLDIHDGFSSGKYRESRSRSGELNYLSADKEKLILQDLPLVDVSKKS